MKRRNMFLPFVILPVLLLPTTSFAMHISEGLLPFSWALFWFIVSGLFLSLGLRTLAKRSVNDLSSARQQCS